MLETNFAGVKLRNPTVLASGILGTGEALMERVGKSGCGMVTTKSIGPFEREGWPNPTVIELETGLLNAVGLPSPGYKNMGDEFDALNKIGVPWIASIYAGSSEEFIEITKFVSEKKPDMIELNISCPNSKMHGQIFGCNPLIARDVVEKTKNEAGKIPIMPKLTPQAHNIADIAAACEEGGANAICAINTVSAMAIDITARKPILANYYGGLSGPAIKPVAVRCVYQVFERVKIPILGMGGITTGEDAIEMIMAGATAIGIGTAVYYRGMNVFEKICNEMNSWMKQNNVKNLKEIIGIAHK